MLLCQARQQYARWLLVAKDLSPHTVRAYESDIAALERHLGDLVAVSELDRGRIVEFTEALRADRLSPRSIRRRVSGVRSFCGWLVSCGLLDSDPSAGVSVAVGRSRVLPRTVPNHELDRLLRALRSNAGVNGATGASQVLRRPHASTTLLATALMVVTGARVHEVVGLRCDDIDLPGRGLRITG